MDSNWAAEHLQVIRTLMERSAVYRRALAPIMIYVGALGLAGGVIGRLLALDSRPAFIALWAGIAVLGLVGAFLLIRRQTLKEAEPFWSPPTRRIAQALLPGVFAGAAAGLLGLICPTWDFLAPSALPGLWMLLYGCALTAAGFFMHRGIKLLGWLFTLSGCGFMASRCYASGCPLADSHLLMGGVFGGLHLAYGVYLYFTEQRRNET